MAVLRVRFEDERGAPLSTSGFAVSGLEHSRLEPPTAATASTLTATEETDASGSSTFRFDDFSDTQKVAVRVQRPGAPQLSILLHLAGLIVKTPRGKQDRRFPAGRPTCATLTKTSRGSGEHELLLQLFAPQEVVMVAGGDTERHEADKESTFSRVAVQRFAMLATLTQADIDKGIVKVNPSCVLTLFEFHGAPGRSQIYRMLPGLGQRPQADGSVRNFSTVTMETLSFPLGRDFLTLEDVYTYVASIGATRPSTVMAFEFVSDGHPGGPVLINTFREPLSPAVSTDDAREACARQTMLVCDDTCPSDEAHSHNLTPMPPQYPYVAFVDTKFEDTLSVRPFVRTVRLRPPPGGAPSDPDAPRARVPDPAISQEHAERALFEVNDNPSQKHPVDVVGRPADFSLIRQRDAGGGRQLADMQAALNPDCLLRTWGCSFGNTGPRFAAFSRASLRSGAPNELLDIRSSYAKNLSKEDKEEARRQCLPLERQQRWQIRRRDVELFYLSRVYRSYAQAFASAMQRPCYTALPGTWSGFVNDDDPRKAPNLAGMIIPTKAGARTDALERQVFGPEAAKRDEGGFTPLPPRMRTRSMKLGVLVSGFAPFGGASVNSSNEGAKLVNEAAIRRELVIPHWIDLSLEVKVLTDVDVVWTCGDDRLATPVRPARAGAPTSRGGKAIVKEAKAMNSGQGADLVLLVGESAGLNRDNQLVRLEHFARNLGRNTDSHADNDGNRLSGDRLELFPGRPQYLEASIPRMAWAQAASVLLEDFVRLHRPMLQLLEQTDGNLIVESDAAGYFVCNESYYQLLREAYFGEGGDKPSGRWVQLVHVAALRTGFDAIGAVLNRTIGTLLQHMLWAPEGFGFAGKLESSDRDRVLFGRGGIEGS